MAGQVSAFGAETRAADRNQMLATLTALPAKERMVMAPEELVSSTVARASVEEKLVHGQVLAF